MNERSRVRIPAAVVSATSAVRKPLAAVRPMRRKGNVAGRGRPNLKPSPKLRELDRAFARHVKDIDDRGA
jgi:hypothetical protein